MTVLLDSNVLIALTVEDHVHHDAAARWAATTDEPIATCPMTQGSLLRLLLREGMPAPGALDVLAAITALPRHQFWPDAVAFGDVALDGVFGHRQVTDAYLAQLARDRGGRLATFDAGLAQLQVDVADLVPLSQGA